MNRQDLYAQLARVPEFEAIVVDNSNQVRIPWSLDRGLHYKIPGQRIPIPEEQVGLAALICNSLSSAYIRQVASGLQDGQTIIIYGALGSVQRDGLIWHGGSVTDMFIDRDGYHLVNYGQEFAAFPWGSDFSAVLPHAISISEKVLRRQALNELIDATAANALYQESLQRKTI